mmetsp:Transcript_20700/g.35091  ORF Transcript_20700/g.35091 Transcript_20700/m.35091 type:complete len:95 (+) Transcript_20700:453-737(+)
MLEKCPVWDVVEEKKRTSEPVKLTVLPPGILGSLDDTLVKDILAAPLVYPKGKRKRMNLLLMTTMTFLHPQFGQKVVVRKQIALLTRMQLPRVP